MINPYLKRDKLTTHHEMYNEINKVRTRCTYISSYFCFLQSNPQSSISCVVWQCMGCGNALGS